MIYNIVLKIWDGCLKMDEIGAEIKDSLALYVLLLNWAQMYIN